MVEQGSLLPLSWADRGTSSGTGAISAGGQWDGDLLGWTGWHAHLPAATSLCPATKPLPPACLHTPPAYYLCPPALTLLCSACLHTACCAHILTMPLSCTLHFSQPGTSILMNMGAPCPRHRLGAHPRPRAPPRWPACHRRCLLPPPSAAYALACLCHYLAPPARAHCLPAATARLCHRHYLSLQAISPSCEPPPPALAR